MDPDPGGLNLRIRILEAQNLTVPEHCTTFHPNKVQLRAESWLHKENVVCRYPNDSVQLATYIHGGVHGGVGSGVRPPALLLLLVLLLFLLLLFDLCLAGVGRIARHGHLAQLPLPVPLGFHRHAAEQRLKDKYKNIRHTLRCQLR
jgi:hypothetical protein